MAMKKKAAVIKEVPPKPKFGEVGYEFLIKATVSHVDKEYDADYPYTVEFDIDLPSSNLCFQDSVSRDGLLELVSLTNPKIKKDDLQQKIKEKQSELDILVKQLAEIK